MITIGNYMIPAADYSKLRDIAKRYDSDKENLSPKEKKLIENSLSKCSGDVPCASMLLNFRVKFRDAVRQGDGSGENIDVRLKKIDHVSDLTERSLIKGNVNFLLVVMTDLLYLMSKDINAEREGFELFKVKADALFADLLNRYDPNINYELIATKKALIMDAMGRAKGMENYDLIAALGRYWGNEAVNPDVTEGQLKTKVDETERIMATYVSPDECRALYNAMKECGCYASDELKQIKWDLEIVDAGDQAMSSRNAIVYGRRRMFLTYRSDLQLKTGIVARNLTQFDNLAQYLEKNKAKLGTVQYLGYLGLFAGLKSQMKCANNDNVDGIRYRQQSEIDGSVKKHMVEHYIEREQGRSNVGRKIFSGAVYADLDNGNKSIRFWVTTYDKYHRITNRQYRYDIISYDPEEQRWGRVDDSLFEPRVMPNPILE